MALIIKCRCGKRLKDDNPCPECGSQEKRYYIDYWPDGRYGKRARELLPGKFPSAEAARQFERAVIAARDARKRPAPDRGTTIDELLDDYLRWCAVHQQRSTVKEKGYSTQHISRHLGNVAAASVNGHHISLYQQARHAQGVSNKTINKEVYYIMSILSWCRDEMKLDIPEVKFKKLKYNRPIPIVLSPDEVIRIIDAAPPFYKAFFLCLYSLGLRLSEARQLTWSNIDYENKTVLTIQKGGSYKILPLNKWLETALLALPKGTTDYVFESRRKQPIVNIRKPLAAAVKKARIMKHVHPHLFRHSIATHMMGADVNMRKVQVFLGHSDIGTTEWYSHVVTGHMRDATKDFFERMSTASGQLAKASGRNVQKLRQKANKISKG